MFGLHFVRTELIEKDTGRFFTEIFDKRQTGDYDDFIEFSREEVKNYFKRATNFIEKIEDLVNKNL